MGWKAGHWGKVAVTHQGVTVELSATNWLVSWQSDTVDISNFKGQGWGAYIDGVPDYDLKMDCIYETTENPFAFGGLNLNAGESIGPVKLFVNRNEATQVYDFLEVVIYDINNEVMVRDIARYTISARASAYYLPHRQEWPKLA